MQTALRYAACLALLGFCCSCNRQSSADVEVIDLNRVLDILVKVLETPAEAAGATAEAAAPNDTSDQAETSVADTGEADTGDLAASDTGSGPTELTATNEDDGSQQVATGQVAPVPEDPTKTKEFLDRFATELNAAQLVKSPIGVHLRPDGSIEGFTDLNQSGSKEGDEGHLFRVQIDAEGSRLIASDESGPEHYHRDRTYHYRPGRFFMGYMLGSMLSRQHGFYQSSGMQPNFRSMQMSPQNYHATAQTQARARARSVSSSSARSRGGSGGFRFGK